MRGHKPAQPKDKALAEKLAKQEAKMEEDKNKMINTRAELA